MGWLANLFPPKPPLFDPSSPNPPAPPDLPFSCRIESSQKASRYYVVSADENNNWSCTCPDFYREIRVPERVRYFCKHCIRVANWTGLMKPRRWKRRNGEGWLIGEIEKLSHDNSRMKVDGYYTSRELYETLKLTPALTKKFFPHPDEEAVSFNRDGYETFSCDLYGQEYVNRALQSDDFKKEWEKTQRRREAARKSEPMRRATLERKYKEAEEEEARIRKEFGGAIFRVRSTCLHGWHECSVYAKDATHARSLVEKWLKTQEGRDEASELYEEALENYQEAREEYSDAIRYLEYSREELISPVRPKKSEFKLEIESVSATNADTSVSMPEDVEPETWEVVWSHDIHGK